MCKYCKLTHDRGYEKTNDPITIGQIKDGSQVFDLFMNRSVTDKKRSSELVLDLGCNINGDMYNIKTKEIKIKYCPFCGEEL